MKKLFLFSLLLFACAKPPENSERAIDSLAARSTPSVHGLKVKELFLTLFPKDYPASEWKRIFDQTNRLSTNQRELRDHEGSTQSDDVERRLQLVAENAEILNQLTTQCRLVLSWAASQNCKISKTGIFTCRPFDSYSALPSSPAAVRWVRPDPVRDSVRVPYLSIRFEKNDLSSGEHYELELRLKVERINARELWLKGDVVPAKNSTFIDVNTGLLSHEVYPFGYVEMTLIL